MPGTVEYVFSFRRKVSKDKSSRRTLCRKAVIFQRRGRANGEGSISKSWTSGNNSALESVHLRHWEHHCLRYEWFLSCPDVFCVICWVSMSVVLSAMSEAHVHVWHTDISRSITDYQPQRRQSTDTARTFRCLTVMSESQCTIWYDRIRYDTIWYTTFAYAKKANE